METMSGLIEAIKKLKDPNTSDWAAKAVVGIAAHSAMDASSRKNKPKDRRKYYADLERVLRENGYGKLNAKFLRLFDEVFENFLALYNDENTPNDKIISYTKKVEQQALKMISESVLDESSKISTSGRSSEIAKEIRDSIFDFDQNIYVVLDVKHLGKSFQISGAILRVANFIENAKPPLEYAKLNAFSTDRNWARNQADEV